MTLSMATLMAVTVLISPRDLASASSTRTLPVVRVDQVGYATTGPKVAYVMAGADLRGTPFSVVATDGSTVLTGALGAASGRWNVRYRFVFPVTFTSVTAPGSYRIVLAGSTPADSPTFTIAPPSTLWATGLDHALSFYENERDGPDVLLSPLRTAPAHLNDEHAMTYATPETTTNGNFSGDLAPLGISMDASGGWWDAGDYLKFVETTSYAVALLGLGARDFPDQMGASSADSNFVSEFSFGISWLEKMWNDSTKTLYYQVGIGAGNATTTSDHDVWRLPQADDTFGGTDPKDRYIRNRPVFEAASSGSPISPNLAGRLAADFGVCAQLFAATDPTFAATCLNDGEDIYALADTSPTGHLLTTLPYGFYPETQWRDDMELGATELAAAVGPGAQQIAYLRQAAQWAAAYLHSSDQDTLNLYDVGGLAHYELARLITATGATDLAVTVPQLEGQLHAQLTQAITQGTKAPFAFGYPWSATDTVSHGAGLSVMASEYDALSGTATYATQAQGWMDNILGANPWGVSFIIGDGTTFPNCPQHQVANLLGSTNGSSPVLAGAAVEGPTSYATKGLVPGMVACPSSNATSDPYAQFNGHGAVYEDNVQSYSTNEPAIDLTAATPLAMAWLSSGGA